jgi:putative Mg2+ transporter-C (MgtC) family protein
MWFFEVLDYLRELNIISVAVRIFFAILVGGLIGIERGKQGRAAGMRTHILVCLGAALTVMLGFYAREVLGYENSDPLRISAQVISGIGFLGVGTILVKGRFQITGLTTAACVWTTATIGLALGAGFYEGALIVFIATFFTVTLMHKLEYKLGKHQRRFGIYVEINSDKNIRTTINHLESTYGASGIQVTAPRSGTSGNVGIEANINNLKNANPPSKISEELEKLDYIVYAIESV